jgi:Flp pilus assembly protein TadB
VTPEEDAKKERTIAFLSKKYGIQRLPKYEPLDMSVIQAGLKRTEKTATKLTLLTMIPTVLVGTLMCWLGAPILVILAMIQLVGWGSGWVVTRCWEKRQLPLTAAIPDIGGIGGITTPLEGKPRNQER